MMSTQKGEIRDIFEILVYIIWYSLLQWRKKYDCDEEILKKIEQ